MGEKENKMKGAKYEEYNDTASFRNCYGRCLLVPPGSYADQFQQEGVPYIVEG